MNQKLVRTPGLYLAGFMASGKTTIARLLADELGWQFADLDQDIESEQRIKISEIFEKLGEKEFRRIESEALKKCVKLVQRGRPHVVALGGGAYTQEANIEMLRDNGATIWLDCPLETVMRRLKGCQDRPLARDPAEIEALYRSRRAAYSRADFQVTVESDDPTATVAAILDLPLLR